MLFTVFLLVSSFSLTAQNEALDSINLQLRQLFSPLARPANNYPFLYDMAAHVTDSTYFQKNCPDTNVTDAWYKVYEEMYHSAYDTTQFVHPETVFARGNRFYSDTIPIGIMDFSHYVLKYDALHTGDYFNFDTVNTVLTDKPGRPSWPYIDGGIFMAAPTVNACPFKNPVFRIDPQLMFYDAASAAYYQEANHPLRIDFGDGNGWISFDPTVVTHHQVTYSGAGDHVIRVARGPVNNPDVSSRTIIGTGDPAIVLPTQMLNFPGIRAGFYSGCNNDINSGKTVIYVGGIDILDAFSNSPLPPLNRLARSVPEIYAQMITRNDIVQLKNFGYNFLVVDWVNSTIDMRYNSMYLVNMIHELKCGLADDHQFVVVGESMGGIIARYALTYMETPDYQNGNGNVFFADEDPNNTLYLLTHPGIQNIPASWANQCLPEKMHNTRLLITLDAPHQGANIPLSVQHAYRGVMNIFGRYVGMALKAMATMDNLFLDAQAAQQLLLYHVNTRSTGGNFNTFRTYTSHADKDEFFDQLEAMGNYPQFAKVVTMSNGDLSGRGQLNTATGQPRVPNDRLLEAHADLFARVLWLRVPVFGGDVVARTNPNGNGQILDANAGFFGVRIRLRLFGIRVNIGYNSLLLLQERANVIPYCTSAGGIEGGEVPLNPTVPTVNEGRWLLGFFRVRSSRDANGCVTFDARQGFGGFLSANFEYNQCDEGSYFCFVPLQSALDYGNVENAAELGHNVQTDLMATKLTQLNPSVDVMIGWPNTLPPATPDGRANHTHTSWRNDLIGNLDDRNDIRYFSCQDPQIRRGMLNLEIGDEELYLENNELRWQGAYQAEYDIHVNVRNPIYAYPSRPNFAFPMVNGAYSRENAFTVGVGGFPIFRFDPTGTPTGVGLNQRAPFPPSQLDDPMPLFICCQNFIGMRTVPIEQPKKKAISGSFLNVYPNPSTGTQIIAKYQLQTKGKAQIQVYGANGQMVLQKQLPVLNSTLPTTSVLSLPNLQPGVYLLRLSNGVEIKTAKFIVIK